MYIPGLPKHYTLANWKKDMKKNTNVDVEMLSNHLVIKLWEKPIDNYLELRNMDDKGYGLYFVIIMVQLTFILLVLVLK